MQYVFEALRPSGRSANGPQHKLLAVTRELTEYLERGVNEFSKPEYMDFASEMYSTKYRNAVALRSDTKFEGMDPMGEWRKAFAESVDDVMKKYGIPYKKGPDERKAVTPGRNAESEVEDLSVIAVGAIGNSEVAEQNSTSQSESSCSVTLACSSSSSRSSATVSSGTEED